jgi:hypothetical protein
MPRHGTGALVDRGRALTASAGVDAFSKHRWQCGVMYAAWYSQDLGLRPAILTRTYAGTQIRSDSSTVGGMTHADNDDAGTTRGGLPDLGGESHA